MESFKKFAKIAVATGFMSIPTISHSEEKQKKYIINDTTINTKHRNELKGSISQEHQRNIIFLDKIKHLEKDYLHNSNGKIEKSLNYSIVLGSDLLNPNSTPNPLAFVLTESILSNTVNNNSNTKISPRDSHSTEALKETNKLDKEGYIVTNNNAGMSYNKPEYYFVVDQENINNKIVISLKKFNLKKSEYKVLISSEVNNLEVNKENEDLFNKKIIPEFSKVIESEINRLELVEKHNR